MLRGFESHRSHTHFNRIFEVWVVTSVAKTATDPVDSAPMVKRYHTDLVSQKRRIVTCLGHQILYGCIPSGCEPVERLMWTHVGSNPSNRAKNHPEWTNWQSRHA